MGEKSFLIACREIDGQFTVQWIEKSFLKIEEKLVYKCQQLSLNWIPTLCQELN